MNFLEPKMTSSNGLKTEKLQILTRDYDELISCYFLYSHVWCGFFFNHCLYVQVDGERQTPLCLWCAVSEKTFSSSCISKKLNIQSDQQFPLFCPDVSVCAHASVSLHLVGMSSEPEVFSVHMNGQVMQQTGHKVSSVGLISGSSTTVSMVALHIGRWLLSSHTMKHREGKCSIGHHRLIVFTGLLNLCFCHCSWHARFRGGEKVRRLQSTLATDDHWTKTTQQGVEILHSCWGNCLGLCT